MKVNVYGKLIDLNIDYRFNGADVDSIKSAIQAVVPIRYITRIKIYHHVLKTIKSYDQTFMCNTIQNCLRELGVYTSSYIFCDILPEFNKENYRNITNTTFTIYGNAWDWAHSRDNRINFLKRIKKQCAVEYLKLGKYE